jgi:p-aminobenzoyl-glutamate transporter AbgT
MRAVAPLQQEGKEILWSSLKMVSAVFLPLPVIAVEDAPINVFENAQNGAFQFLLTIVFFFVPYFLLNNVIAPKLGWIKEDVAGKDGPNETGRNPWD